VDVEYPDEKPALFFFYLACALLFLNFRMRWLLWLWLWLWLLLLLLLVGPGDIGWLALPLSGCVPCGLH